jgi:hypothetical protein
MAVPNPGISQRVAFPAHGLKQDAAACAPSCRQPLPAFPSTRVGCRAQTNEWGLRAKDACEYHRRYWTASHVVQRTTRGFTDREDAWGLSMVWTMLTRVTGHEVSPCWLSVFFASNSAGTIAMLTNVGNLGSGGIGMILPACGPAREGGFRWRRTPCWNRVPRAHGFWKRGHWDFRDFKDFQVDGRAPQVLAPVAVGESV